MEDWGETLDKLNNLKQTKDYYKLMEYKDADKQMKKWDKNGVDYNEAYVMQQVVDNVKKIEEGDN